MTRDEATRLVSEIKDSQPGIKVRAEVYDCAPKNADGTYTGEVIQRANVTLRLDDARTGNGVCRVLRDMADWDPSVVAGMRAELASAAKRTRAAVRAEKEST